VSEAPAGQDGAHDDKETVASSWVRPQEALDLHATGQLMMMPPTIKNLRWLDEFATADDVVEAGRAITDPRTTLPKVRTDETGAIVGISLPGDPDYDTL